ncbi:MAG: penicillin-binding protein 2 [Chlamydiota bacterium]|nr:penicillin-binding protein 2 [Chlamydiota bacterium]
MNSDHPNKKPPVHFFRLIVIAIGIFSCFTLLILQFYHIQISENDKWQQRADRQHYFTVSEPFVRGTFFSNTTLQKGHVQEDQPLVFDIKKYHLYVDPMSIQEHFRDTISERLLRILNPSEEELVVFRKQFDWKSRSRKLVSWLDQEEKDLILSWWLPYARKNKIARNALYFVNDYRRSYPFGKLLGQLLHTIRDRKDETSKQAVPTGGLEYRFHSYLKGKQGKRKMMRSPRSSFDIGEVIEAPEHGCDIYLTVNHILQAICEQEIEKGVNNVGAKGGWAVMMEPSTGDILALAQYPFFYPPDYQKYYNDKDLIEHTRIKAATDAQEPASVMKGITAATALLANEELVKRGEKPLFDPEEKMPTANGVFPGRSAPIKDTRQHNYLNMDMAIQKSSNIYVARLMQQVVNRLGNEWYRNILIDVFGFGKKTGIELPSESPGVLPKPGRKHPNGKLEWSVPTPFSMAMGHNLQSNTFQMLRAFSTLANGGYLVQPNLVRKIVRTMPDGKREVIVDRTTPEWYSNFPQVLPKHIVERVVQSIKYVTKPGGGGWRGDVWGYTEAGKTGTAKKIIDGRYSSAKYCASFIGFTPVEKPAFILMVVIDEPDITYRPGVGSTYYGSVAAAPVFKRIAQRSLEYLGVPVDDPYGYSSNDPRYDAEKADWKKQARLLKEKYEMWNK